MLLYTSECYFKGVLNLSGERVFPFVSILAAACVVLLGLLSFSQRGEGLSFVAGIATISIPQWVFYRISFSSKSKNPKHLLKRFYLAELVKLMTFSILCTIFIIKLPLIPPLFFVALIITQISFWALGLSIKQNGVCS